MALELYEGVVVNNIDSDQVGRVQIRIPALHGNGVNNSIPNGSLPWFEPCNPFYGGYQSGSFIVPPVGAVLWCMIDDDPAGNTMYVYLGGVYGTGCKGNKVFGGNAVPKGVKETPKEALEGYPNSAVIFKSLTGSCINVTGDGTVNVTSGAASVSISSGKITLNASNVTINAKVFNVNGKTFTNSITSDSLIRCKSGKVDTLLKADELAVSGNTKTDTLEATTSIKSVDAEFTNVIADNITADNIESQGKSLASHTHTDSVGGHTTAPD